MYTECEVAHINRFINIVHSGIYQIIMCQNYAVIFFINITQICVVVDHGVKNMSEFAHAQIQSGLAVRIKYTVRLRQVEPDVVEVVC